MHFGAGLSSEEDAGRAAEEAYEAAAASLNGEAADLAVVFHATLEPGRDTLEVARRLRARLGSRARLLGCTAQGVVGTGREVEAPPALALLLASMPGVQVRPFTLGQDQVERAEEDPSALAELTGVSAGTADPFFLLLADPLSSDPGAAIRAFDAAYPGAPVVGGLASGGLGPGENRFFYDEEVRDGGAIGLALTGAVNVRTVVSQGCRPIGKHRVITRARGNVIEKIGGKPALEVLKELIEGLDERERNLARRAIHLGRVIDEHRETFGRGDFLIRNLIGVDPDSGAVAASDLFRTGQTIQFHVRDGAAASEDLRAMLEAMKAESSPPGAGLAFTCNGRGSRFFGRPDHDATAVREVLGDLPLAGFFCNGELGPIGSKNFLHGFTCSAAFIGPP